MDRANGGGPGAAAAASRAERFEDEKRRIIESCFSKKDVDGSRKSCGCCPPSLALNSIISASGPRVHQLLAVGLSPGDRDQENT